MIINSALRAALLSLESGCHTCGAPVVAVGDCTYGTPSLYCAEHLVSDVTWDDYANKGEVEFFECTSLLDIFEYLGVDLSSVY